MKHNIKRVLALCIAMILALSLPVEALAEVAYCFMAGDELVGIQTVRSGEAVERLADPAAPEGMVFAGWFFENGEPAFADDEPIIASADLLTPEIKVIARFIEAPAAPAETDDDPESPADKEDAPESPADTDDDTATPADTDNDPESPADKEDDDTDAPVGTPEMASGDEDKATTEDGDAEPSEDEEAPEDASLSEEDAADAPEDASLSEGGGAAAPEGVVPFDQSVVCDGVCVTVRAAAGCFPADARLSVTRVLLYEQNQADAAVDEVRDEDQNVAARYTFDISIRSTKTNRPSQWNPIIATILMGNTGK